MKSLLAVPFIGIPYRQLYFLQLENYNLGRFLSLVRRSYSFSSPRQKLVWTVKLVAVANIAFFLEIVSASVLGIALASSLVYALLMAVLFFLVFP